MADRGEIRVGSRYQTEVTPLLKDPDSDPRKNEDLESLVWTPSHSLNDRKIDQFLVVSRSVGTFARALDCSSSVKQPSLHMSAAAASRDITLVRIHLYFISRYSLFVSHAINFNLAKKNKRRTHNKFIKLHLFSNSFMQWTHCTNIIIR